MNGQHDTRSISDDSNGTLNGYIHNNTQQRLYVINKAGSGEAHYLTLNNDRTGFLSYQVKIEQWNATKDICNFGVAVVDNVLYVIGGYNKTTCVHVDKVFCYDPCEGTWTERERMIRPRAKFTTAVVKGTIVICGGELSDGRVTSRCDVYDPETNTWTEGKPLIAPRANHACAILNEELYSAGGCFGCQSHRNLWVFENQKWEELDKECPQKLPVSLDRFSMVTHGRAIYFIGGVSCKPVTNSHEKFMFSTERRIFSYQTSVSAMSRSEGERIPSEIISPWGYKLPTMNNARHNHGVQMIGNKIYVMGGSVLETGQQIRETEFYNTDIGVWEEDFCFRKGDVSNVTCAVLEIPVKQNIKQTSHRLKWILW